MFVSDFLSVCVCEVGREGKRQMGRQTRGWWETLMDKDLRTAFRSQFFLSPRVIQVPLSAVQVLNFLFIWKFWIWRWDPGLGAQAWVRWWILKHWLELLVVRMGNGLSGFSHLGSQALCGWSAVWSLTSELSGGRHWVQVLSLHWARAGGWWCRTSVDSSVLRLRVPCCADSTAVLFHRVQKALQTHAPIHTSHGALSLTRRGCTSDSVSSPFVLLSWTSSLKGHDTGHGGICLTALKCRGRRIPKNLKPH